MKKRYYIFLIGGFAVQVPRKAYNWLTEKTWLCGMVEFSDGD